MDTTTHTHHASHTHAATGGSWSMAARATLHCLTGCAIGEVLGLVIGTALGLSTGATIALAIGLAFVFGYALTLTPVLRSGVALKAALAVTLAADTVSITVMELVDNSVMLVVPGAMDAGLGSRPVLGRPGVLAGRRLRADRAGQPVADRPGPRPRGRPRDALTRRRSRRHAPSRVPRHARMPSASGQRVAGPRRTGGLRTGRPARNPAGGCCDTLSR